MVEHRLFKAGEFYGLERLSYIVGSAPLPVVHLPQYMINFQAHKMISSVVRSNAAVHSFTIELQWSHNHFYVNQFYLDRTAHTDTKAGNCGKEDRERRVKMGQESLGCKIRSLKFRIFTNTHQIDHTKMTIEPAHLHCKYKCFHLFYGAGLDLEGQCPQCGGLIQVK